jgi:hypothetical protein
MMLKQSGQVAHIEERMLQLEAHAARDAEREQHVARLEQRLGDTLASLGETLAALDCLVKRGQQHAEGTEGTEGEAWTVYQRPDDTGDTPRAVEGDAAALLEADA